MSYNIRLDVKNDGENWWMLRKDKVAALMNYYDADFIGAQEVQQHQLLYLDSQLTRHSYIGVGREDGKQQGEFSCIFYNEKKYQCLVSETFWLSETQDTGSKGWDAAYPRICTYGLFQSKERKQRFWVFNTHLDHMGKKARLESVKMIAQKIREVNSKKYPVLITGDFNSKPDEEPCQYFSSVFTNTRNVSEEAPYGPIDTWNAFRFHEKPNGCIDYVFKSADAVLGVRKFITITDHYDLKYPSDHFPVMTTLYVKK